jgi:ADP-ribosyl-[dinitrogen reductase] hydrolase
MADLQRQAIPVEERALGAYLGLAVGDALGATVEFMTPREIAHHYTIHQEIIGGGWLKLKAGAVTDDTEMTLALGKAILSKGEVEAMAVAEAFSDWMRAKPVDIGATVRRGISHFRRTGEPRVADNPQGAGNGACMRCLPIALINWCAPESRLVEDSRSQAHTTHNNPQADIGSETVLRMLTAALRGEAEGRWPEITEGLYNDFPEFYSKRRTDNPSGWIVETLQAVFQGLQSGEGFEKILVDVVNRGGDADTTGAIAGMLAGARYGRAAIPERWSSKLDPDVRQACEKQALELLNIANQRTTTPP